MRASAIRGRVVRLLVLGAAVTVLVTGTLAVSAGASVDSPASFVSASAPVSGYDAVVTRVDLDRDGDAHWRVEYRYELTDGAARRAFARARANVSNPPGVFVDRMRRAVGQAEQGTDRSMAVQNGSVRTRRSVPSGRFGVVSYRFTWTNFAATPASNRYVVGDAIGGLRLGENESLWIEWPDDFERASVTPDPDASQDHAVRWTGPLRFRTEDPTVALDTTAASAGDPLLLVAGGATLLLVTAAGWYGRRRWRGESSTADDGTTDAETAAPAGADGADSDGTSGAPADEASEEPPAELLTDEERVLRLLEAEGGRMKQQDLIAAVEWSRTKASDVVNEMHEAERIEVYRLGRENVLALPGEIEV